MVCESVSVIACSRLFFFFHHYHSTCAAAVNDGCLATGNGSTKKIFSSSFTFPSNHHFHY